MSDDQDHPRGGDAGTERAIDELRVALEQLAARMGAGLREDLAQIRAIAASVAERDLTADVEALRVDVATLIGRDPSAELGADLAALRESVERLSAGEDAGAEASLAPLQAAVDRISARLDDDSGRTQVLARFEALESKLDRFADIDGSGGSREVLARLDTLATRLDALPTSQQVSNLSGDLRAHLVDALAGFDVDAVVRAVADVRSRLGDGRGSLLEQLQDNLADVASGEVVGALWDEVRQLRADLPDLVAVPEPVAAPAAAAPDPQMASLLDGLAALRSELDEGLVVEPSDALSASLDALRAELDGLRGTLGELQVASPAPVAPSDGVADQVSAVRSDVDAMRNVLEELRSASADQLAVMRDLVASEIETVHHDLVSRLEAPAPAPASVDPETVDLLLGEIRSAGTSGDQVADAVRAEIDGLRAAIEELRDRPAPEAIVPPDDQIAALRDFVASELDAVQQSVAARLDAAAEATASAVAAATSRPETESAPGAIDPEVIEGLRDEIRAAGAIGDQVVDALREELKALRRRIAVKAAERVLDDQQLAQIADAVATRLAEGRTDS